MNRLGFLPAIGLVIGVASVLAQAPAAPPAPSSPAASAATAPRKRPLSPEELRDSATMPGELHPAQPAKPQISIPLGRKPPAPLEPAANAVPPDAAGSAVRIDDSVARCKALTSARARAACLRAPAASANGGR